MRVSSIASQGLLALLLLAGCAGKSKPTQITVSPPGPVQATASVTLTATVVNSSTVPSWTLSGPGSLSDSTGRVVVYRPPALGGPNQTATVTAQADGASATVQLTLGPSSVAADHIPGLTAKVDVFFDANDIPHLFCAQANDCLAVQGYLHARDRFFPMDFLRHVGRGTAAELAGPLLLSQDVQLRTLFTTRDGQRLEDALVSVLTPDNAARLKAFAAGVNIYLAELRANPKLLPGEYAQLPSPVGPADIADWTAQDTLAIARLNQYELSSSLGEESDYGRFAAVYAAPGPLQDLGKLNTWIRAASPVGEQTHTLVNAYPGMAQGHQAAGTSTLNLAPWADVLGQAQRKNAKLQAALRPHFAEIGSNNWVVDAAHSAAGQAMVANDPHLSLQYPPLFHLSSMTSANAADNLDLSGGAFPGVPGALVGRGKNVGWGVTVVGYDVTDIYLEQAVPCPGGTPAQIPFCVNFNSVGVPVVPYPVTFKVRVGPGAAGLVDAKTIAPGTPAAVLMVPHHGPVIQAPDGTGKFLSVRWTGQEGNTQDLTAFWGLNTAKSVADAMAALSNYATGAQNFVLADDQGHIGYDPHALVPVRGFADYRVVGPANVRPPWFPLPGDGSAEWGSGAPGDNCAGAGPGVTAKPAAACWIPDGQLPHGTDPAWGYYATANADPIGVSDNNNPLASPPYLSFDWDDSTGFRHARIVKLLHDAIVSHGKVSLSDMEAIQSDHVSTMGGLYAQIIATLPEPAPEVSAAKALMAQWSADGLDCPTGIVGVDPVNSPDDTDAVRSRDSAGCMYFHFFVRTLLQNVFTDDLALPGVGLNSTGTVKGMLYMLQPGTPASDQKFCNDVDRNGTVVATHSCTEQVLTALVEAWDLLTAQKGDPSHWRWGRVHTMQPVSQLPLVTTGYQPGPFARPGGAFTVDVGSPSLSGSGLDFAMFASGNVRHISIMDPVAPVTKMQLPGPERDGPVGVFSNTPDLLGAWVRNQYFDYLLGTQVQTAAAAEQTFNP